VIAAQHQGTSAIGCGFFYQLRETLAGVGDLREIAGMRRALGKALWLIDYDVAPILDVVAEVLELFVQSGNAQCRRTHVDAATSCSEVHGGAENGDVRESQSSIIAR
jgi:hypothetical protein